MIGTDLAAVVERVREALFLVAGDLEASDEPTADRLRDLALELDDALPVTLTCDRCARCITVRAGDVVAVNTRDSLLARLKGNGLPCGFCYAEHGVQWLRALDEKRGEG